MSKSRAVKITLVVVLLLVVVAIYISVNPATSKYFPKCLLYSLTGYKCPGCGSQRAIHSILNGNFIEAIKYNAFLMVAIPLIVFYLLHEYTNIIPERVGNVMANPITIILIGVVIVAWWILRNVFDW